MTFVSGVFCLVVLSLKLGYQFRYEAAPLPAPAASTQRPLSPPVLAWGFQHPASAGWTPPHQEPECVPELPLVA
ncbi:hypothetical protein DER45DRAFT_562964 [Fusarium avenaceum]|nr:hypothetical protein DER45DRAFT_562964 [Fusarium avenaceum]